MHIKEGPTASTWTKVGETEVVDNNLNPDFKKAVEVFYQFEISQTVKLEVIDDDGKGKFDIIGQSELTMGQLAGAKNQTYESDLYKGTDKKTSKGKIIVRVNPIKKSSQEIEMKLGAKDLPMVSSCCSSNITPFIVIDKSFTVAGKENYTAVHKTEVNYQNINNPSFTKFKLKA